MMHHTDKVKIELHLCTCALADGNHRCKWRPFHVQGVSITGPALHTIKGEAAVQCSHVSSFKGSSEWKNGQVRARGKMRMHNVERSSVFQCFMQVIIGFGVCSPGYSTGNERFREK